MSENVIKSMKSRRSRIASLIRKELSTLFKDKISMFILFIIPVVMIVTVGAGEVAATEYIDVDVWVIDFDNTYDSNRLIESLRKNVTVTSNWDVQDQYTAEEFLDKAKETLPTTLIAAYIIIPEGFGYNLTEYGKTSLEVHVDSIDFISALAAELLIQLGLVQFQLESFSVEAEIFYFPEMQPELSFSNLLQAGAPSIVSIVLFATANLVATQSVVGDIPLKRLLTTPLYRSEVVVAKNLAYSIVAVFQIIISLGLLKAFNVPIYGLFIDVFLILWLCSMTGISLGVLFSTVSKTRLQAAQMFLFGFMIMLIITLMVRSPFVLPFLPLEQTQVAFSNVAYRGMSLLQIIDRILYLILDTAIFFTINIIYLRRKKEFV
ncbi:MAG: ABC transporter permease subunit [Candidatus Lokiarchaeota archaeon]|nr:ABC transporter permease subunit [Candidatus Lokiarchaeota archaeon]